MKLIYVMVAVVLVLVAALIWRGRSSATESAPSGRDKDAATLAQLRSVGSDLRKVHDLEFFLYFPTEEIARQAAGRITELGFVATVQPSASGSLYLCEAHKAAIPELDTLVTIRKTFESLASSLGGEYDGWGTEVVK